MVRDSSYCKYSFKIKLHEILGKVVGKNQKKRTFKDFSIRPSESWWRSLYSCRPVVNRAFSLTCPATMQINCNKRKRLHKKRVQLPQYWCGTQTWPPFQCVIEHQYGRHDVMWKCWITFTVLVTWPLKISFNSLWTVCYIYNKQIFFMPVIRNRNCLDSFCPPIS